MFGLSKHIESYCKSGLLFVMILIIFSAYTNAQPDRKFIRQGNKEYGKEKFSDSEISYRKAIDKNKESADAIFNIGDALYKQKKFEEAGKQFTETHNMNEDKGKKASSLYNLGNSLLMANKVEESIGAYKESLKLNPRNSEAKYNLAYAQDLLKQQQQQQQQKDKDKQDQKKNDQNKDQQEKQDNKDQEQKNDQQQQEQQQDQQQEISKEDAQRLLNALANDEKNVQEKVKLAKASKARVRTVKNW